MSATSGGLCIRNHDGSVGYALLGQLPRNPLGGVGLLQPHPHQRTWAASSARAERSPFFSVTCPAIGELRKKAGCKVSEQVRIGYVTRDAIVAAALSQHRAFVEGETLSQLAAQAQPQPHGQSTVDLDDSQIELTLLRG